jgi:hypothetical protein
MPDLRPALRPASRILAAMMLATILSQPLSAQPADGFQGVRPAPLPAPREPPHTPAAAAPAAPQPPATPATGLWAGQSDAASGACSQLSLRVRRQGARLSGEAADSRVTVAIEGAIGDDGRVSLVARLPQGSIGFVGRLDGERMILTASIPGQCQHAATLVKP